VAIEARNSAITVKPHVNLRTVTAPFWRRFFDAVRARTPRLDPARKVSTMFAR